MLNILFSFLILILLSNSALAADYASTREINSSSYSSSSGDTIQISITTADDFGCIECGDAWLTVGSEYPPSDVTVRQKGEYRRRRIPSSLHVP